MVETRAVQKQNNVTSIFIVIVIILFITILYVYRYQLFSNITSQSVKNSDYGTYETQLVSSCVNNSGLCGDPGTQVITEKCIPNSITGYGCLTDDLNPVQTFANRITKKECSVTCKKQIWKTLSISKCLVDSKDLCVPKGTRGSRTTVLQCVPNDGSGINSCSYLCGSHPDSDINIPKCVTDGVVNAGQVVLFNIGDQITYSDVCEDFINPICGVFGFEDAEPAVSSNGIEGYNVTTSRCQINSVVPNSNPNLPSLGGITLDEYEANYPNSNLNYKPFHSMEASWIGKNMDCVDYIHSETIFETKAENARKTICSPLIPGETCYSTEEISNAFQINNSTNGVKTCGTDPQCAEPSYYVSNNNQGIPEYPLDSSNIPTWMNPSFQKYFGTPNWIYFTTSINGSSNCGDRSSDTSGDENNPETWKFISLYNVPCPGSGGKFVSPSITSGDNSYGGDCLGNPSFPLETTPLALYPLKNYSYWGRSPTCTSNKILSSSSMWIYIRPLPQNTELSNSIYCNIIGLIGSNYYGWLRTNDNSSFLYWEQADLGCSSFGKCLRTKSDTINWDDYFNTNNHYIFRLDMNSDDTFTLRSWDPVSTKNDHWSITLVNTSDKNTGIPMNHFTIFPYYEGKDMDEKLVIDTISQLQVRNSRCPSDNLDTCNVLFSYAPSTCTGNTTTLQNVNSV